MEKIVELLTNAENWRTLAVLAAVLYGYVRLNTSFEKRFNALDRKIDGVEASLSRGVYDAETSLSRRIDGVETSLSRRIDGVEASLSRRIDGVEASLSRRVYGVENAVKALTYTLEKNKSLEKEDKEYVVEMIGDQR